MRYRLYKGPKNQRELVLESKDLGVIADYCGIRPDEYDSAAQISAILERRQKRLYLKCLRISETSERTVRRWLATGGVLGFMPGDRQLQGRELYIMSKEEFDDRYSRQRLFSDPDEFARYMSQTSLSESGLSPRNATRLMDRFLNSTAYTRET